jgi:hypothetical protein
MEIVREPGKLIGAEQPLAVGAVVDDVDADR